MNDFKDRENALASAFLKTGDLNDLAVLADLYAECGKAWEESFCRELGKCFSPFVQDIVSLAAAARVDAAAVGINELRYWTEMAFAEAEADRRVKNGLWHFDWVCWHFDWVWQGCAYVTRSLHNWSATLRERHEMTQEVRGPNNEIYEEVHAVDEDILDSLHDIELGEGDAPIHIDADGVATTKGYCRFVNAQLAYSALARESWYEFPAWTTRPLVFGFLDEGSEIPF